MPIIISDTPDIPLNYARGCKRLPEIGDYLVFKEDETVVVESKFLKAGAIYVVFYINEKRYEKHISSSELFYITKEAAILRKKMKGF